MKDRQAEPSPSQPRIPVLSTVLHCVSMTVVVFLRGGFGFAYFRPRSVFLASIWAFALFTVYAWNEPAVWQWSASLCVFGMAASALYLLHFTLEFARQLRGSASHDHDSGNPHLLRLLRKQDGASYERAKILCAVWCEPALVLLAALLARWFLGSPHLSAWLLLAAACLWLKEAMNYWHHLRQRKRRRDAIEDAEETLDPVPEPPGSPNTTSGRKEKTFRPRTH